VLAVNISGHFLPQVRITHVLRFIPICDPFNDSPSYYILSKGICDGEDWIRLSNDKIQLRVLRVANTLESFISVKEPTLVIS
jgi:hypothetical protein